MKKFIIALLLVTGCAHKENTTDVVNLSPSATVGVFPRMALNWEDTDKPHPERKPWSDHLVKLVRNDLSKFKKAKDWSNVCPKWGKLNDDEKVHAISTLIIAMIYYESGYNPRSRMQETTMGIDPVTKKPVYSEGLLQLSYQDIKWAPWCKFEWVKDKILNSNDPQKTILDPYLNLSCGVPILANQTQKKEAIFPQKSYWAVTKMSYKRNKFKEIKARVLKYAKECGG